MLLALGLWPCRCSSRTHDGEERGWLCRCGPCVWCPVSLGRRASVGPAAVSPSSLFYHIKLVCRLFSAAKFCICSGGAALVCSSSSYPCRAANCGYLHRIGAFQSHLTTQQSQRAGASPNSQLQPRPPPSLPRPNGRFPSRDPFQRQPADRRRRARASAPLLPAFPEAVLISFSSNWEVGSGSRATATCKFSSSCMCVSY